MKKGFIAFAAGYLLATPLAVGVVVCTGICGFLIGFACGVGFR